MSFAFTYGSKFLRIEETRITEKIVFLVYATARTKAFRMRSTTWEDTIRVSYSTQHVIMMIGGEL